MAEAKKASYFFLPCSLSLDWLTSAIVSCPRGDYESVVSYLKKQGQFSISCGGGGGGCGIQCPVQ